MSKEAKKEPWTLDEMELGQHPRVYAGSRLIACFGNAEPWLEHKGEWVANAKLFLRAQHLDELVEAVHAIKQFIPIGYAQMGPHSQNENDRKNAALDAARNRLCTILAKIEGQS